VFTGAFGGEGGGGDVAVGGDAEVDVLGSAGGGGVGLGEFAGGGGEADLEAGVEVVADLLQAVALGGVDAQEGAADGVLTALTKLWASTSGHAETVVVTVGSHDWERSGLAPGSRVSRRSCRRGVGRHR
jgi:hypothetical protein